MGDNRIFDPCQEMPVVNIRHQFLEIPVVNGSTKLYAINIEYPISSSLSKIVTESQTVDIHTLIGNVGGYIGMFLGEFVFL